MDENSDWGFPDAPAQLATDNKHQLEVPILHSHLNKNLTCLCLRLHERLAVSRVSYHIGQTAQNRLTH